MLTEQNNYKEANKNRKIANEQILEEVADELGLPIELVREVVESQFNYAARVIKMGNLESITIPYLGKFKVNPRRIQKASTRLGTKE